MMKWFKASILSNGIEAKERNNHLNHFVSDLFFLLDLPSECFAYFFIIKTSEKDEREYGLDEKAAQGNKNSRL